MYLYSLLGWEHNIVIVNDREYSQKEFEELCKKAPHDEHGYYYISDLMNELKKHGFKNPKYSGTMFTDSR